MHVCICACACACVCVYVYVYMYVYIYMYIYIYIYIREEAAPGHFSLKLKPTTKSCTCSKVRQALRYPFVRQPTSMREPLAASMQGIVLV